jgi:hypothetical protein
MILKKWQKEPIVQQEKGWRQVNLSVVSRTSKELNLRDVKGEVAPAIYEGFWQ